MTSRSIPASFIGCIAVLACAMPAFAESHAKAALIADVASVTPGQKFHVAVAFSIDPEWHVYWTNPGDSGLPTKATFTSSSGVVFTPLALPVPEKIALPGGVVAYGYRDKVLLIADAVVPADAKPGAIIDLAAAASWLVCKDACIPGKAKLALSLPVVAATEAPTKSDDAPEIDRSLQQVPLPADASDVQADRDGDHYRVTVAWKNPVSNVAAFSVPPDDRQVQDVKIADGLNGKTIVTFTAPTLDGKPAKPFSLPMVFAYDDPSGQRRGVSWEGHWPQ